MKPLLMEDDCAPDAYEYFCKKFEEITGTTVTEFKASAIVEGFGMIIIEIWLVTGAIMSILAWTSEYVSYKRNPCLSPKFKPTDYETILTYVVFAAIYPAILLIILYRKLKR